MRWLALPLLPLLIIAPLACGSEAADEALREAARSAAEAMRQAAEAVESAGDHLSASGEAPPEGEAWTAEAMQEALPASLSGLERTSLRRESTGAAGIRMAQATASYGGEGRELEVQLVSGGGIMAGPAMAFALIEFDRSDDRGYERTITRNGMKGMQTWNEAGATPRATLTLLVHRNLLVRLEGTGVTMDELERAFDALPLR